MIGVNPLAIPQVHDFVVLGGLVSPGVLDRTAGITGFSRPYDWDVKKGKGLKGATTTAQGGPPSEGKLKFILWRDGTNPGEPDDFADWDTFSDMLEATLAEKVPTAMDILHPYLTARNIGQLVVKDIGILTHQGGGEYSATVSLIEYRKPVKSGGTAGASVGQQWAGSTLKGKAPGTAESSAEDTLKALLAQAGKP